MGTFRRLIKSGPRLEREARARPLDALFGSELIVSRKLCAFRARSIKGQKVDRKLLASLIVEARSMSGLPDPGTFVTVGAGYAQIWTWDQHAIATSLRIPARQMVPESVFHAPASGFILRVALDGVEGQFWASSELIASQWWPSVPDSQDWALFKRSCGSIDNSVADHYPDLHVGYVQGSRRRRNRVPAMFILQQIGWAEWGAGAIGAALVPAAFLAAQNVVMAAEASRLSREQAGLQDATSQLRSTGRQIARLEGENQQYAEAMRSSNALAAISPVFEEIDRQGGQVDQVLLDKDTIDVTVSAATDLAEREIVVALEDSDALDQVSLQRQGGALRWSIRARKKQNDG